MRFDKQNAETIVPHPSENLNDDLKEVYKGIRKMLDPHATNDIWLKYEIGGMVDEVCSDERRYGEGAVARLAKALGRSDSWLYDCQKVRAVWSFEQLQALIKRGEELSHPIRWKHLRLLAYVRPSAERNKHIEELFSKLLSTCELEQRVAKELRVKQAKAIRPRSQVASVLMMNKIAANYADKLETHWDQSEDFLVEIESGQVNNPEDLLLQVGDAIAKLEAAGKQTTAWLKGLQSSKASLEKQVATETAKLPTTPARTKPSRR